MKPHKVQKSQPDTRRRSHLHRAGSGAFPVRKNSEFKRREGIGDARGRDVYTVAASALPSHPTTRIGVRVFQVGQLSRDPEGNNVKTRKNSQQDDGPGGHCGEIHCVTSEIHAAATVRVRHQKNNTQSSTTCWPTAGPYSPRSRGDCRL